MTAPFGFAGGLAQTDWFGLGTGIAQTAGASASYNQAGYLPCVQLRQNQVYQDKNYHLSWVTVARDDVRGMMQASTNRMANYVMVGTLILQTAIGILLQDNLGKTAPPFVAMAFWITSGLAVMFFTSSIAYSVRGQNNAFLNTMRLLAWEIRPENPAAYDFDYMRQINRFEQHGFGEIFRMPGSAPKYETEEGSEDPSSCQATKQKNQSKADTKCGKDETRSSCPRPLRPTPADYLAADREDDPEHKHGKHQAGLEELEPDTRELLYLERFGRYMQLWQVFDTHSKYCIGLGLICMSHGASFWCLGRLAESRRNMNIFMAAVMTSIFVYMGVVVYHSNFKRRNLVEVAIYVMFGLGPALGIVGIVANDEFAFVKVARCLCMISQSGMFVVALIFSSTEPKRPNEVSEKYIVGPSGQRFACRSAGIKQGRASKGKHWDADLDSDDSSDFWSDSHSSCTDSEWNEPLKPSHIDQPGICQNGERVHEDLVALQTHQRVLRAFRMKLCFALFLWVSAAFATLVDQFAEFGVWLENVRTPIPELPLEDVPMSWPSSHFRPGAMACASNTAFAANAFQVVKLNFTSGLAVEHPCKINRTIKDLTVECNSDGDCQPVVLLSDSRLVYCDTGEDIKLLQNGLGAQKISLLQEPMTGLVNSSLMVLRGTRLVENVWDVSRHAWAPKWQLGSLHKISEMSTGCPAALSGHSRCKTTTDGSEVPGRRLRPLHSIRAHNRRGYNGRGVGNQGIVVRSGRNMVWSSDEEGDGVEPNHAVVATIRNMAITDDGLLVFRTATARRGWVEKNLVTLVDVPSLEVVGQWHLPLFPDLVAGCALNKDEVLVARGRLHTTLSKGTVLE